MPPVVGRRVIHSPTFARATSTIMHPYTLHHGTESDSYSDTDDISRHSSGSSMVKNPTRKRRRGMIEKRRRDRINTSLCELKKLVPQALEKSGSAKLEKAEILQMTVDHLKLNVNHQYDHQSRVARDYHSVGFQECATEVSRYLVSVEGMDIQDPIRLRLMSHLQMFIAQRSNVTASPPPPPPPPNVSSPSGQYSNWSAAYSPPPNPAYAYDKLDFDPYLPNHSSSASKSNSPANYTMTMTASVPNPSIGFTAHVQANPLVYHYPYPSANETAVSSGTTTSTTPSYTNLSSSKPYRPWGAKMAC